MQPTVACANCGAEIPVEARFCRSCGQPSARFKQESVTEGTTRLLETQERPQPPPPAYEVYERPGELAQATTRLPPQTNPTSHTLEPTRKPTNWVLISAIIVAALALIATGLIIGLRSRTATPTPPIVKPGAPPVPPAVPPPAPPPPPTTGVTEGGTINPSLIYPGAKTLMQVTGGSDGNVIQLQTSDSFDKVVDWYKDKLKPEQIIQSNDQNTGMPGRSVILPGKEVTAIINSQGDVTNVMLAQEDD